MRNDRHFGSATPARSEVEGMQSGPPVEQLFSPEAPPSPLSSRPELRRSVVERSAVQRSFPGNVSVQQLLSPEAPPSPLSSRPELRRSVVERSAVQRSFPGNVSVQQLHSPEAP